MADQTAYWQEKPRPQAVTLQRLAARWQEQRGDAALPASHHSQLRDDPDLVPWVMLVAIEPQPNSFRPYDLRNRFIGYEAAQYFGVEEGLERLLSELGSPFAERWFDVVDRILATKAPGCFQGSPHLTGYDFTHFEMLVLPYSRDGATIDVLLAAFAMSMLRQGN